MVKFFEREREIGTLTWSFSKESHERAKSERSQVSVNALWNEPCPWNERQEENAWTVCKSAFKAPGSY